MAAFEAQAQTPRKGGVLRISVDQAVAKLNPLVTRVNPEYMVSELLYSALTRLRVDMSVEPDLAQSWTSTADLLEWTFILRQGVTFHDGSPCTASDVVATFEAILDPKTASPARQNVGPIAKVTAKNDATVVFTLSAPFADLPVTLAYTNAKVIPASVIKSGLTRLDSAAIGTGPFKLVSYEGDRKIIVERNPAYYDKGRPYLDRIEIVVYPDSTAEGSALISGDTDMISTAPPTEFARLQKAKGVKALRVPSGQFCNVNFGCDQKPFNDVRVRQAMNMAVNRDAIVEILLHGATVTANQPAGRYVLGYDPGAPPYPYDPAKARALLASAGHPDGFRFTLETAGNGAAALSVYQQVAADLKKVGVTMEIRTVPVPQFFRDVLHTGDTADAITLSWISAPSLDVLPAIRVHSCLQQQPWYCDPDVTPLYTAAVSEFDDAKGLALRRQISLRYHDQAPALFLYEQVLFAGLSKRVSGFEDVYGFISYDKLDIRD